MSQAGESDPFEAFNRAMGAGRVRDPSPIFAALPVCFDPS